MYSKTLPGKKLLEMLDNYLETVDFRCGDVLIPEEYEETGATQMREKFYHREKINCRDVVEKDYFNYGGLRGRAEFEHICAICGNCDEESKLIDLKVLSAAVTEGRQPLPLCMSCYKADKQPVLVKRSDKVHISSHTYS